MKLHLFIMLFIYSSTFSMQLPNPEKQYLLISKDKLELFCKNHRDIPSSFLSSTLLHTLCGNLKTATETTNLINLYCQDYNKDNPTTPILGVTRNALILAILQENNS